MDFTEGAPDGGTFSLAADIPPGPFWSVLLGGIANPFSSPSVVGSHVESQTAGPSPHVASQPDFPQTETLP